MAIANPPEPKSGDPAQVQAKPFVKVSDSEVYEIFHVLGLTLNEARLLVIMLALGNERPSTAAVLSRVTGIQRTETYNYILSLENKGLVTKTLDRPFRYFTAGNIEETIQSLVDMNLARAREQAKYSYKVVAFCSEYKKSVEPIFNEAEVPKSVNRETGMSFLLGANTVTNIIERMLGRASESIHVVVGSPWLYSRMEVSSKVIDILNGIYHSQRVKIEIASVNYQHGDFGYVGHVNVTDRLPRNLNFVIVDGREMILCYERSRPKKEIAGIQLNEPALVNIFSGVVKSCLA